MQEHWQRQFSGRIRRAIYSMVAICADMDNTNLKHEGEDSLETANSVMKEVWMNARESCGKTVTINRNYLYSLLLKLEKENFDSGYHLGYSHRGKVQEDELPIDSNFKDLTVEW